MFYPGRASQDQGRGRYFQSHIDGHKIFMGPEESMQIQSNLGSTIAMAFDECPSSVASREYVQASVDRTTRWLERCKAEMARLNGLPDTVNKEQRFSESIRELSMQISVLRMQIPFPNWIWTAMQLAVLQLGKLMSRCIIFWTKSCLTFRRTNLPI